MEFRLLNKTWQYKQKDVIRGALVYSIGDSIAAILLNEFSIWRLAGIMLIGACIYAFEIPNYFAWIEQQVKTPNPTKKAFYKTGLALLYFNPLWIARHLFFIKIISEQWDKINPALLNIALWSFLWNIPISFIANYIIQNKIAVSWRFLASAIFSGLMAIYYALSTVFFA